MPPSAPIAPAGARRRRARLLPTQQVPDTRTRGDGAGGSSVAVAIISYSLRSALSLDRISALVLFLPLHAPICMKGGNCAAILPFAGRLGPPGVLAADLPCVAEGGPPAVATFKCLAYHGVARGCVNYYSQNRKIRKSR